MMPTDTGLGRINGNLHASHLIEEELPKGVSDSGELEERIEQVWYQKCRTQQAQLWEFTREIGNLTEELNQARGQIDVLQEQLRQEEARNDELVAQVDALRSQIDGRILEAEVDSQLRDSNARLRSLQQQCRSHISVLRNSLREFKSELIEVQAQRSVSGDLQTNILFGGALSGWLVGGPIGGVVGIGVGFYWAVNSTSFIVEGKAITREQILKNKISELEAEIARAHTLS